MKCGDMKCGCYKISEGTVYYYQSYVNMMNVVEKSLVHHDLLNKHIKEESLKIRATAKDYVPEKIIETTELNEDHDKDEQFNVKNNNEECKEWITPVKRVPRKGVHNNIKKERRVELSNIIAALKEKA